MTDQHTPTPHAPEIGRTIRVLEPKHHAGVYEVREHHRQKGVPALFVGGALPYGVGLNWKLNDIGKGRGWGLRWEYADIQEVEVCDGELDACHDARRVAELRGGRGDV